MEEKKKEASKTRKRGRKIEGNLYLLQERARLCSPAQLWQWHTPLWMQELWPSRAIPCGREQRIQHAPYPLLVNFSLLFFSSFCRFEPQRAAEQQNLYHPFTKPKVSLITLKLAGISCELLLPWVFEFKTFGCCFRILLFIFYFCNCFSVLHAPKHRYFMEYKNKYQKITKSQKKRKKIKR